MGTPEQDAIVRAKESLDDSGIDSLAHESMSNALSLAATALEPENHDPKAQAKALYAMALALSHFMSGSRKYAIAIVTAAVKAHDDGCKGKCADSDVSKMPWSGVLKMMVIKSPQWIALIVVALIVTDKVEWVFKFFSVA